MRLTTKIWLIVATILVVVGTGVFVGSMTAYNWDFEKLSTNKYVTNSYEIKENFNNISISVDTTDVEFLPTEENFCSVTVFEDENEKHTASVENDTLIIKIKDTKKWHDHIGINFSTPKMTVFLPKNDYRSLFIENDTGDVNIPKDFSFENLKIEGETSDVKSLASVSKDMEIKVSTGDVNIDSTSIGELRLTTSTGDVKLNSINVYEDVDIKTDTGSVTLKNVIATGKLNLTTSTGDVTYLYSDGNEIFVTTSTGDVSGTLLTEKVFITETSTGDVSVPKTLTGGLFKIKTSTGDITINVVK